MIFHNPLFFLLLLFIPVVIFLYFYLQKKTGATIKFSSLHRLKKITPSKKIKLRHISLILLIMGFTSIVFALSRPRTGKSNSVIRSEGIDIMLALDISGSMRAEDFKPNRLYAAKNVISDFIKSRKNDRIGLIVYGSEAFLKCPLTLDHNVVLKFLQNSDFIEELENSTAIGMAIATAVFHLDKSKTKSKIIILLTDGDNNAGDISPEDAAELAYTSEIKVYTIGVGTPGETQAPITINHPIFGKTVSHINARLDVKSLQQIAKTTEGTYFNAQNSKKLRKVYKQIDKLEKSEISSNSYYEYNERFITFLFVGIILLVIRFLTDKLIFRKLP